MSKHTPGPWVLGTDRRYPSEPCVDAVIDGVVWHIALCHPGAGPDDSAADANARLIASAPDLYNGLREALPALRADYERLAAEYSEISSEKVSGFRKARDRYEAALAAIDKVEGRRPIGSRNGNARAHR